MKDTTKVMGNMNKVMKPQDVMKNMQAFERESAKLGMSEEMMNDTLGMFDRCFWLMMTILSHTFSLRFGKARPDTRPNQACVVEWGSEVKVNWAFGLAPKSSQSLREKTT